MENLNKHYKWSSFLKGVMKMDDIDPFSKCDKPDEQPDTDKTIPSTLGGMIGVSCWEPEREQETSFGGGKTQRTGLKEAFHFISTISNSEMEAVLQKQEQSLNE